MKLMKKSKTCLASLLVLSLCTTSFATPGNGNYARLEAGSSIPWDGWCFDGQAIAQMIADKEMSEQRCDLRVLEALDTQRAKFDLDIGKLNAEMKYELGTRDDTIGALQTENLKLEEVIIHNHKFGWIWPAAIGTATGAAISLIVMGLTSGN